MILGRLLGGIPGPRPCDDSAAQPEEITAQGPCHFRRRLFFGSGHKYSGELSLGPLWDGGTFFGRRQDGSRCSQPKQFPGPPSVEARRRNELNTAFEVLRKAAIAIGLLAIAFRFSVIVSACSPILRALL